MLLMMIERGEPIHSAVFFDGGWEFPGMLDHIDLLESQIPIPLVRVRPEPSFDHWMYDHEVIPRSGPLKGQVRYVGAGWPSYTRRWCTRLKVEALQRCHRTVPGCRPCVGFAADETRRIGRGGRGDKIRYPLIEWGVTSERALEYCLARDYTWGGLYSHFERVSCYCCPLQRIDALRALRRRHPSLWAHMLDMDKRAPAHNRGFLRNRSVHDMDERFEREEKQMRLKEVR